MPAGSPASRQSTRGRSSSPAAILVDAPSVVLDGLAVNISVANVAGCAPVVAGIYLRNASGRSRQSEEYPGRMRRLRPIATPAWACSSRAGRSATFRQAGQLARQWCRSATATSTTTRRAGSSRRRNGAIVKIRDTGVFGDGAASVGVQNGIELSFGVKARAAGRPGARLPDARRRQDRAPVMLAFGAHKARLRRSTITACRPGVFDRRRRPARCWTASSATFSSDGMVFLGSKNRALGNMHRRVERVRRLHRRRPQHRARRQHHGHAGGRVVLRRQSQHGQGHRLHERGPAGASGRRARPHVELGEPAHAEVRRSWRIATTETRAPWTPATRRRARARSRTFPTLRPVRTRTVCNGNEVCVAGQSARPEHRSSAWTATSARRTLRRGARLPVPAGRRRYPVQRRGRGRASLGVCS